MPLAGLLLAASLALGDVAQVEAHLSWLGIPGRSETYDAILRPSGGYFVSTSTYHLRLEDRKSDEQHVTVVANERVSRLLRALSRPVERAPHAADFGITQSWVDGHAERAFQQFLYPGAGSTGGLYSPAQRSLYVGTFTDPRRISTALLAYYSQPPTLDDYVYVEVDVRFKNWHTLTVVSQRPETLMLPWTVSIDKRRDKTFDPAISAAIEPLFPTGIALYDRLSLASLLAQLSGLVGDYIKPAWQNTPAFDVSALTAPLEKEYGVRIDGPDSGVGDDDSLVWGVWGAKLKWPDLPPAITGLVALPVANNTFTDILGIPAAKGLAAQTYAVPWLHRYLDAHPGVTVEVLLERGGHTYLDLQQEQDLLADLHAAGRDARAAQVEPQLGQAFKVLIDEPDAYRNAEWVVFPDSTMLLWDYFAARTPSTVLGLDPALVAGKACAKPSSGLCSGLMLSPDGGTVGD